MNRGKLEVLKQKMARVNTDILGIDELKWTGMGEFNSDDHYIYHSGQESLRRNGVAPHNKQESKMQYLDCGSDHELLIAKYGLKLKKVEKNH